MAAKAYALLGPTASGKSEMAFRLAERVPLEIVSMDSAQVYRGLDIGTAKPSAAERNAIPHHLVDIVDPIDEYTAARYARDAAAAIRDIHARGRLPILAGGTGFYYRALTRGLFPGPGRDAALRARLESIGQRRGVEFLHRMLRRVDRASAGRIPETNPIPSATTVRTRIELRLNRAIRTMITPSAATAQHNRLASDKR